MFSFVKLLWIGTGGGGVSAELKNFLTLLRAIIIRRIVDEIVDRGRERYDKGGLLNTLVILDEAQRLVPREKYDDDKRERLRMNLI